MRDPRDSTARKLRLFVSKLDKVADAKVQHEFGISFSRSVFLQAIRNNSPLTQHELAVILGQSDPAVSTMLTELKKKGLVQTKPDPSHGKRKLVELSKDGSQLTSKLAASQEGNFQELLNHAEVNDEDLREMLDRMLTVLEEDKGKNL